ncbi:hypothetical protein B0J11DRAFT_90327 [Dendryphion nanum]|uniref:Nuclear GTPase SLIP-GC n=1 Tax=Dendryphion nanum TaxID=256645 RepID=A0A9P9DE52_9PLEO|nr:hypothetical protein B0J11DRAFT_90327 [Dendryphion nanum]
MIRHPMDWAALQRQICVDAKPPEELPAKRFFVGVLYHDKSLEQPSFVEADFLWIKAHAKVRVEKIAEVYRSKVPEAPPLVFKFQEEYLSSSTLTRELNRFGDGMIILRAIEKANIRSSLQPTNRQVTVISFHQSPSSLQDAAAVNSPAMATKVSLAPLSPIHEVSNTLPHMRELGEIFVMSPSSVPQPPSRAWTHAETTPAFDNIYIPSSHKSADAQDRKLSESDGDEPQFESSTCLKAEPTVEWSPVPRSPTPVPTFDADSVFTRKSPGLDDEVQARPADEHIRKLIEQSDPNVLEAGVSKAQKVLDTLKKLFMENKHIADAQVWTDAIDKLRHQAERKRTVVGVVGNTGAGKSSVINAMLDEERLVPTNCMRACTAVVTEISWNSNNDPQCLYRAHIEFISVVEWEKELGILLKEFLTENGTLVREASDQNSDAGIAWAKFHAVYPKISKDMLAECTVDKLISERSVRNVLGTEKCINSARPGSFYQELQRYVDSKEKSTGKSRTKGEIGSSHQMEFWPLIKVVKIYTKASALSTGAVVVDLPGVHDSNAARAAVANNYMKQCTGLWIVAPINRAVDDKAAKSLLGESFKRQLKYDGGFSSVTFICSKTDDISITEAADSLELDDQIDELEDKACEYEKQVETLRDKQYNLRESEEIYAVAFRETDDELQVWKELQEQFDQGQTVYAPKTNLGKRKNISSANNSRKRRQSKQNDSEDDVVVSDDEIDETEDEDEDEPDDESDFEIVAPPRKSLDVDDLEMKITQLRSTKAEARRHRAETKEAIKDIVPRIKEVKAKATKIRAEMNAICIAGRNEYSKGAIQLDFAAGIKELDQENAAEEDEETFNPDEDLRNYDEVAKSLPVFCVSSRAYQKLCGRLQKDGKVPGFKTPEETEIPQLQAHCRKLTETGRIQTCRTFLLSFCQQLNTLSFWVSDTGAGGKLTDGEKRKQISHLQRRLFELRDGLDKAIETCINATEKQIREQIYEKFPPLVQEAVNAAPETARGWGAPRNDGGLLWVTYKAIVRRDGAYQSSSAGYRNFNGELVDPIVRQLATGWERAFQHRLPKVVEGYTAACSTILDRFHETIEERARQNGVGLANVSVLKNQLHIYGQIFGELGTGLVALMNEMQRDANRDFTPTIIAIMQAAYTSCTEERGTGSFARMKTAMLSHVEANRHKMFKSATETITNHLKQMCRDLEEKMANKADEVFANMQKDYLTVLGGVSVDQATAMPESERAIRKQVQALLFTVDPQFESLADDELEQEVKDDVGDATDEAPYDDDNKLDDAFEPTT